MRYRTCPICHETHTTALHTLHFQRLETIHLPSQYDIVVCNHCQLVYADTAATQADYDRYYQENNGYETKPHAIDLEKYKGIFLDLRAHVKKTDKILEVGFSNGALLSLFKEAGYAVYGLDPSHACVTAARARAIQAFEGTLTEHTLTDTFDVIILSHVMEHILDMNAVMNQLKTLLSPNGRLYLETPDLEHYAEHSVTPFNYFDLEHINHFAVYSLTNLVQQHGLQVIASGQKTLPIIAYPACWVIAAVPAKAAKSPLLKNDPCIQSAKVYIEQSLYKTYPEIQTLIDTQEPVIIWGAGSFAQRLFMMTELNRCNIQLLVDNDPKKWGKHFGKYVIQPPSIIQSQDRIIIISIYYSEDIVKQIHEMRLNSAVIILSERYTRYAIPN